MTTTCSICHVRIAALTCRRCKRKTRVKCMSHHGLCKECREKLPRLEKHAIPS